MIQSVLLCTSMFRPAIKKMKSSFATFRNFDEWFNCKGSRDMFWNIFRGNKILKERIEALYILNRMRTHEGLGTHLQRQNASGIRGRSSRFPESGEFCCFSTQINSSVDNPYAILNAFLCLQIFIGQQYIGGRGAKFPTLKNFHIIC